MNLEQRRRIATAVGVAVLIWASLVALGTALHSIGTEVLQWDAQVVTRIASLRTAALNDVSNIGSSLADTTTCIAVATIALFTLRLWLHRWREGLIVVAAILGELLIFLAVTASIERDRPEVKALDVAPPTSSFPSGHVGAAVALYGSIAIVLLITRPGFWPTSLIAMLLLFIPSIVAVSRIYRGMHFPTDVVAGALGGGSWLVVCILLLIRSSDPPETIAQGTAVRVEGEVEHGSRP